LLVRRRKTLVDKKPTTNLCEGEGKEKKNTPDHPFLGWLAKEEIKPEEDRRLLGD